MAMYLDFEGKQTPVDDLSWFRVAPCGCYCGATIIDHFDGALVTPEQATDSFNHGVTAAKIKQDEALGWTVRLGPKSDVQKLREKCPHMPAGGFEPAPTPAGWKWQAPNSWAHARDRKHLVQNSEAAGSLDGDGKPRDMGWGTANCGKRGGWWDRPLGDLVECAKCLKAAQRLMVENEVPF